MGLVTALLRRPPLWAEVLRALWAHRRRGGFALLPVPSAAHLAWRRETVYGDARHRIEESDLVGYLQWRSLMRKVVR